MSFSVFGYWFYWKFNYYEINFFMLNFKDNVFFIRWSAIFFIVSIFGYWGIDLNSEELYIAFSFFFLVIVAFLGVRHSNFFSFTTVINKKFSRVFMSLFTIGSVRLRRITLLVGTRAVVLLLFRYKSRIVRFLTEFFKFTVGVCAMYKNINVLSYNALFSFWRRFAIRNFISNQNKFIKIGVIFSKLFKIKV